ALSRDVDRARTAIEQRIGPIRESHRTGKLLFCVEDDLDWSGGHVPELRGNLLIGVFEHRPDAHPRRLIVRPVELNDKMRGVSWSKWSRRLFFPDSECG